ncbi:hypothetical protein C8R44DRAFT_677370 [Mycena epipterygia]|nr:hypothetical protein C8R44DRAFT_677370 [Mycena epipterygia]
MSNDIKDAPEPFSGAPDPEDNVPPSDFILRSGDGIDLHVHKDILRHVSVFFRNMFGSAGDETEQQRDGKPVAVLPESGDVLHRLLCFAYPGHSVEHYSLVGQNLDGVWAVHEAANKYLFTDVQRLLESTLENPNLLDAHPHRLFAIARLRGIPTLARKAALCTLKHPLCPPGLQFPEMELLTAASIQKLYDFHRSCGIQAQSIADRTATYVNLLDDFDDPNRITQCLEPGGDMFVWWDTEIHNIGCGAQDETSDGGDLYRLPVLWFRNRITQVADQLRSLPTRRTVELQVLKLTPEERESIECHACLGRADIDLMDFKSQLANVIEESNNRLANADGALGF